MNTLDAVLLIFGSCLASTLGIEDNVVYDILDRRNVWDRINNWKRPEGIVTHKFPQGQGTFPLDLKSIQVPSVQAKFINDTDKEFTIYSVSYTEIQKLRPSAVDLIHDGHPITVPANTCGRGVCFIQDQDGPTINLAVVQKNTMVSYDYRDLSVTIYLTASHHDHVIVHLHPPVETGGPPRLDNYMSPIAHDIRRADNYSPAYTAVFSQSGEGVRPNNDNKARIDTQIHRSDNESFPSQMSFGYLAGPGKYKTTQANMTAINGSDVIYSEEVDFNNQVFNDAIVTSTLKLKTSRDRDPHNLAVYIKLEKVYFILQEGESMPKTVKDQWKMCNLAPEFVEVGDIFILVCRVFHPMPVTVSWSKLINGQFVGLDGFDVDDYEFSYYTTSATINYAARSRDAGLYQFQVFSNDSSEILRATNFTISVL